MPAPPAIGFFIAEPLDVAVDQVQLVGLSPPTYNVGAGSDVHLSWSITNAITATLSGIGDVPLVGSIDMTYVIADQSFTLTANGLGGIRQAYINLVVVPRIPPPAPYNVTGSYVPNTATINWEYNRPELIIGFRVYRDQGTGYVMVADENVLNADARTWIDTSAQSCSTYYVVAVYDDPYYPGLEQSDPSTNYWDTPCP